MSYTINRIHGCMIESDGERGYHQVTALDEEGHSDVTVGVGRTYLQAVHLAKRHEIESSETEVGRQA